ncbi:MAG: hypothetical protein MR384_12350 [Lachnospiraceae bacterium]|nr:hypothetical protein [Lachnospiraceae bacterium]
MSKIKIALLDDISYSRCFSEYVSHKKNDFMDVQIFTGLDSIRQYLADNIINILLVGQDMVNDLAGCRQIKKIIVLSEGDSVCEYSEYPVIFKYQSIDRIIKEIFNIIADDDSIEDCQAGFRRKDKEIIGVFSPFGGSGVSMFSWKLVKQINSVKKTLYINLEMFDGLDIDRKKEYENEYIRGMSEAVFYIKQKKGKLGMKIQSIIHNHEGCDCILPVDDYRDLYSITAGDMNEFIDVIARKTDYETIIFDIGFISEASLVLMKSCDKLMVPKAEDSFQNKMQESFEKYLMREGMEDVLSNINFVNLCSQ